jgi:hypothetical protein
MSGGCSSAVNTVATTNSYTGMFIIGHALFLVMQCRPAAFMPAGTLIPVLIGG